MRVRRLVAVLFPVIALSLGALSNAEERQQQHTLESRVRAYYDAIQARNFGTVWNYFSEALREESTPSGTSAALQRRFPTGARLELESVDVKVEKVEWQGKSITTGTSEAILWVTSAGAPDRTRTKHVTTWVWQQIPDAQATFYLATEESWTPAPKKNTSLDVSPKTYPVAHRSKP